MIEIDRMEFNDYLPGEDLVGPYTRAIDTIRGKSGGNVFMWMEENGLTDIRVKFFKGIVYVSTYVDDRYDLSAKEDAPWIVVLRPGDGNNKLFMMGEIDETTDDELRKMHGRLNEIAYVLHAGQDLMDNIGAEIEKRWKANPASVPKSLCSVEEFGQWKDGENVITWVDDLCRPEQRIQAQSGVFFIYTTEEPSDKLETDMEAALNGGRYLWVARVGLSGVMTVGVPEKKLVDSIAASLSGLAGGRSSTPDQTFTTEINDIDVLLDEIRRRRAESKPFEFKPREPKLVGLSDEDRETIVESLDITLRLLNLGTLGDIEPDVFKARYNIFKVT